MHKSGLGVIAPKPSTPVNVIGLVCVYCMCVFCVIKLIELFVVAVLDYIEFAFRNGERMASESYEYVYGYF